MIPITSYNLIHSFIERNSIIDDFSQFNLFSFVLYDRAKNPEIERKLIDIFNRLDYFTGEKLLVFALIDQPDTKLNLNISDKIASLTKTKTESINNALSVRMLADEFKIPSEALPAIIVTNTFKNQKIRWYKTSELVLEKQYQELGLIAHELNEEDKKDWKNIDNIIRNKQSNIDLCGKHGEMLYKVSFAKVILPLLKILSNEDLDFVPADVQQWGEAKLKVNKIREYINSLRPFSEEDEEKTILFEDCYKIINKIIKSTELNQSTSNYTLIREEFLEKESRVMLKTASVVAKCLKKHKELDYASVGIGLVKLFENELDLSIVQWMRKHLGIDMPEYFNKYQADKENIFVKNHSKRKIQLNKMNNDKWVPPNLGDAGMAFEIILKKEELVGFDKEAINNLIIEWKKLIENRNGAFHNELMTNEKLQKIIDSLNHLEETNIFNKLFNIKESLRSNKNDLKTQTSL